MRGFSLYRVEREGDRGFSEGYNFVERGSVKYSDMVSVDFTLYRIK